MSCHNCASKFSLFSKEQGCPNCGFSFCSKCLREKTVVNNKQQKVCTMCFNKQTKSDCLSAPEIEPPAFLLKRLESLENPAKPPITLFRQKSKLSDLKIGLTEQDQKIIERLEKLKEDRKAAIPPSEQEIKRRLAILQGKDENTFHEKSNLPKEVKRSQQEQIEDLLKQCMDETGIDKNYQSDFKLSVDDIEKRLQNLKGFESVPFAGSSNVVSESDDVDHVTAKIVEKALEEAKIEKTFEEKMEQDCSEDDSEFPWCIICNEDAVLRCMGCDASLYCASCFKEGHDYFEMKEHKTVPFSCKSN